MTSRQGPEISSAAVEPNNGQQKQINGQEKAPSAKEYKARKQLSSEDEKRSFWHFPELQREQRKEVVTRLTEGAEWSFSFGLLTALSSTIASFGLIQGSTATVIGAMVVAPLMLPLIAAGLSLVQSNVRLLQNSLRAMGWGTLGALLSSFVIGLLIPWSDVSTELLARGNPGLLDIGVAYFAGFAAAYAVAKPELLGALAGVAIAVALVPPLATCGIGLADGLWSLAYGAGLLFLTNMVAIVLGAATVFRFVGINTSADGTRPSTIKRSMMVLGVMGTVLVGLLGYRLDQQLLEGQNRPTTYPLTPYVIAKIENFLENHRNIRLVFGGRAISSKGEQGVKVFLSTNRAIERDFIPLFEKEMKRLLGQDLSVNTYIFQEVIGSEATTYAADSDGIIERDHLKKKIKEE